MSESELWLYTVGQVLNDRRRCGQPLEEHIQQWLDDCGGNVSQALKRIPANLGHFGSYGPGIPSLRCWGTPPQTPISVWSPERWVDEEPDLTITWREVFEYVKNGKVKAFQMTLF